MPARLALVSCDAGKHRFDKSTPKARPPRPPHWLPALVGLSFALSFGGLGNRVAQAVPESTVAFEAAMSTMRTLVSTNPAAAAARLKEKLASLNEDSAPTGPARRLRVELLLAQALLANGDRDAARETFERVLERAPSVKDRHTRTYLVAQAQLGLGRFELAFTTLVGAEPETTSIERTLLATIGAYALDPRAREWLCLAANTEDAGIAASMFVLRAIVEAARGDRTLALQALDAAMRSLDRNPRVHATALTLGTPFKGDQAWQVCATAFLRATNRSQADRGGSGAAASVNPVAFNDAVVVLRSCLERLPVPERRAKCPADMVAIEPSSYLLGFEGFLFESSGRTQVVELDAFCIDRTEVTVAAFRTCAKKGKCGSVGTTVNPTREKRDWDALASGECNGAVKGRELHPMNCVDWTEARRFCHAHGKRLPTEAEWELAATGGDGRRYPWGKSYDTTPVQASACFGGCTHAFFPNERFAKEEDGWLSTAPVASFPLDRSPAGVLDLAGNVREWVEEVGVQSKSTELRGVRGGSWLALPQDRRLPALQTHAVYRVADRRPYVGFRCARAPLASKR